MTCDILTTGLSLFRLQALKKRLAGKRDDRRRWRRQVYAAGGTSPVDELLQCNNYYDNEAVDNMINEFIDNRQKTTVGRQTWGKPRRAQQYYISIISCQIPIVPIYTDASTIIVSCYNILKFTIIARRRMIETIISILYCQPW